MADVQLRHGRLWLVALASLLIGAGLMTSTDPRAVSWGIALLLAPLIATTLVLAVFYWKSRRE